MSFLEVYHFVINDVKEIIIIIQNIFKAISQGYKPNLYNETNYSEDY